MSEEPQLIKDLRLMSNDICEMKLKLEEQQKKINFLKTNWEKIQCLEKEIDECKKESLWHFNRFSTGIYVLEKQRDIDIQQIKKLEEDFASANFDRGNRIAQLETKVKELESQLSKPIVTDRALWQVQVDIELRKLRNDGNKCAIEIRNDFDKKLKELESKLSQQNSMPKLSQYFDILMCSHCKEEVNLKNPYSHQCKKTNVCPTCKYEMQDHHKCNSFIVKNLTPNEQKLRIEDNTIFIEENTNDLPINTELVAKKIDSEKYGFSSGKIISPHRGIIGLAENHGVFSISEGYDSLLYPDGTEDENEEVFTIQERIEIANYQIELWKQYKNTLVAPKKTKTLWIAIDKKKTSFFYQVSNAYETKEELMDNWDEISPNIYKIEIEVDE